MEIKETPQGLLATAVKGSRRSIEELAAALRHFNYHEWPDQIRPLLARADELVSLHGTRPGPSVADDYANLAGTLGQLSWPSDIQTPETNNRVAQLRGCIGMLRMDCDAILKLSEPVGLRSDGQDPLAPDTSLIGKANHGYILGSILKRLDVVEAHLCDELTAEVAADRPPQQIPLVRHYIQIVRTNAQAIRAAIIVGPYLSLSVLDRAGNAIAGATSRLFSTIYSASSKATTSLKLAVKRIRTPVANLVRGVRTLLHRVVRERFGRPLLDSASTKPAPATPGDVQSGTVGSRLRAARLKAGLEIEDVSAETRIHPRYLHAIEAGHYEEVGPRIYIVGFVRAYTRMVGENETELVAMINGEIHTRGLDNRPEFPHYKIDEEFFRS